MAAAINSSAFMENLRQLFAECDVDNHGSLGRQEFSKLCSKIGLNKDAANETFERLDIDKNERITFDEFAAGFNQYKQTSSSASSSTVSSPPPPPTTTTTQQQASRLPTGGGGGDKSPALGGRRGGQPPPLSSSSQANATKLSPGPLSSRGRKSASPLGVMSLGSTGSSSNLANSGHRSSSSSSLRGLGLGAASDGGGDLSTEGAGLSSSLSMPSSGGSVDKKAGGGGSGAADVVVYSSDMIGDDQACGSGQFGSLMSSSGGGGSLNQLRNVQDLLTCVQKLQSENQILTQIFFKDKREREEYISQLGEEFDQQVREVEERANRRAKEELEQEKRRLREMMQTERETLQHHYQTIEKMGKLINSPGNGKLDTEATSESIDKVRSKLEDTYLENRQLKKSLLDTKTDVAMIWKEMEKLKRQYEDKLSNAYERNNETRSECDHIKQQLNLMKDSNRKLQDASDVITHYITDKVEPVIKGAAAAGTDDYLSPGSAYGGANSPKNSNSRKGSILSEYLNNSSIDGYNNGAGGGGSANSGDVESLASSSGVLSSSQSQQHRLQPTDEQDEQLAGSAASSAEPSPRTTSSSAAEMTKTRFTQPPTKTIYRNPLENSIKKSSSCQINNKDNNNSAATSGNSISGTNQSSSLDSTPPPPPSPLPRVSPTPNELTSNKSSIRSIGRHFFIGTRAQSDAQVNTKDDTTTANIETGKAMAKALSADNIEEVAVGPADGPSKATFNIILVGDSFVGKSSFAARFMEGCFVQGLISNCSIDFKTKAYKVDGTNYTVNLWDTAGQERFRSITASYFRKADGIILMYDVTDKRSYLNVRNWMSTISDTAAENVAVLLIGNKIDLRQRSNKENCVPTEEGHRLAKEYDIVFLETSVKTGTNLVPSMGKLIRLIAKNNTPTEEDNDRIRLSDKGRTFKCMPKSC